MGYDIKAIEDTELIVEVRDYNTSQVLGRLRIELKEDQKVDVDTYSENDGLFYR